MLCGEIFRDLLQVVIGEIGEQVVHRREVPAPGVESMKLVHKIAGGLPRKARKVGVVRPFAHRAVTWGAGHYARFHRVRSLFRGLRITLAQFETAQANESYVEPASFHGAPPTPATSAGRELAAFLASPASPICCARRERERRGGRAGTPHPQYARPMANSTASRKACFQGEAGNSSSASRAIAP